MPKRRKQATPTPSRNGADQETTAGYFRRIFKEKPALLTGRSNAELLERWLADHPGNTKVPSTVKNNLSNLKSVLRKKRRRRKAQAVAAAVTPAAVVVARPKRSAMETLEEQIDDCLTFARNQDREGLHEVIVLLRKARNAVVWKMGQ